MKRFWIALCLIFVFNPVQAAPPEPEVVPEGFGAPAETLEPLKESEPAPHPSAPISPDLLAEVRKVGELTKAGKNALRMPTDVAVGPQGQIYVVDSGNNRVVVYSPQGKFQFAFAGPGEGAGQLLAPVGIATASDGSVLVADRGNSRIQIFDADGTFLRSLPTRIRLQKVEPVDVVLGDQEQRLYVTISSPLHRVLVYNDKGRLAGIWGKPGSNLGDFRFPATLAEGPHNDLYVVDVFNSRVQVFDHGGKVLATVGSWGVTPGRLFRPKGVTVRPDGSILVSDSYLGVVQLFDPDTRFRAVLGMNGDIARFDTPAGLAVGKDGKIYVVEMLANRVSVLQMGTPKP